MYECLKRKVIRSSQPTLRIHNYCIVAIGLVWEEKQVDNELFIDLYELKYINIVLLIYNVGININDKIYLSMYNSIIYTCR